MDMSRPLLASVFLLPLAASAEPVAQEKLQGTWRDADRKSLIKLTRDATGLWWGKTIEAVQKKEAGKVICRKLVYDAKTGVFTGLMIKPDDDDEDDEVTMTSPSRLSAQRR